MTVPTRLTQLSRLMTWSSPNCHSSCDFHQVPLPAKVVVLNAPKRRHLNHGSMHALTCSAKAELMMKSADHKGKRDRERERQRERQRQRRRQRQRQRRRQTQRQRRKTREGEQITDQPQAQFCAAVLLSSSLWLPLGFLLSEPWRHGW
jgi:hypothetical protein